MIFRRWAGIAVLAGALERKLWVRTLGANLYPNMYIALVGPPGVGKSVALAQGERLWRSLKDHHIAPTSVTKAALVDALAEATRRIVRPGETPPYAEFNSIKVIVSEMGQFITEYDNEFMNALTGIYDGYPYAERRRGKDIKISIPAPQINILTATTPSYLNAVIPEGAWDQGFLSRTLLIYSGEMVRQNLFAEPKGTEELFARLAKDLEIIGNYYGKLDWDPAAATRISEWHTSGGDPVPDHPKLLHYTTRRTAHVLKLCMVAAVSRADFDYTIIPDDVEVAMNWLIEAEEQMPDIFRSMNSGGDSAAIEDTWHMAFTSYARNKRPLSEAQIIGHLRARVPSHSVDRIIMLMEREGLLKPQMTSVGKVYIPTPRVRR